MHLQIQIKDENSICHIYKCKPRIQFSLEINRQIEEIILIMKQFVYQVHIAGYVELINYFFNHYCFFF